MAIQRVKELVCHVDDKCEICHTGNVEFPATEMIEVLGTPTEIGISTCKICFDNIQIAIGEISQEY